jgi:hypothetical protein
MTLDEIAMLRLYSQRLEGAPSSSPAEIVRHMGAVQAQDYAMAKWAVGVRSQVNEAGVTHAIEQGDIIRTHVLRPTWHLVAAEDIRWMLMLTAPNVKKQYLSMSRKQGLDERALKQYNGVIARLLENNTWLTREEILQRLKLKGSFENDQRPAIIMMNAELDAVVCNGPMRGKQFTYALLDERVKLSPVLSRDEALAKLAGIYFNSHGPATLQDFRWWSGLSVADSKKALELVKSDKEFVQSAEKGYWFSGELLCRNVDRERIHFLPAFDEFLISYADRVASISPEYQSLAFTKNGIFKPVIVVNGQVIGTWKRLINKQEVQIETMYFVQPAKAQISSLIKAAERFADYVEKKPTFI